MPIVTNNSKLDFSATAEMIFFSYHKHSPGRDTVTRATSSFGPQIYFYPTLSQIIRKTAKMGELGTRTHNGVANLAPVCLAASLLCQGHPRTVFMFSRSQEPQMSQIIACHK